MLKKLTSGFLLAFGLVGFSACDQTDLNELIKIAQPAPSTKVNLTAIMSGSQEVPAVSSAATGTFTGVYDKNTNVLTYTVTYTGLTPVAGHLHRGAPGMNGPVIFPFPQLTSPVTATATFTEDDEALLLNNGFYSNLHSAAFPGGEIRGNITVK
ncbi:CHRD domain containing protein [Hymenobacter roseosalivarius DSM 11622]|uniref:CHRD domain containing protein n=1 Tax=Hymenobacter roseosalivarius DSM 11622 TaxID=645990 RepID=A0A1W1UQ50_9BACT|nr:CHRD domain-containing protein [Hymenobacter roseosalivarius]SMB83190.1 CHRD domain containing protein [Hymenobacter roseosalivarius DSM 11622]